ncbi:MAG: hypothetical protein FJ303_12940 [Planctomycetes bacterium]|nr:hypothetical protein [Planctomycetota bacterium]
MAAPATTDDFLDLVRKSGVADEKRLDAFLAKMRPELPAEPAKVAGLLVHHGVLTNFQAENILAGKWRRFSIGKYKVLERLGSGGFAQVYLCEHKLMRRRVAVKVLPVAKTKDSSALARFRREAEAVGKLDHPNIVQAFDIDQDEDLHFLVMEYIDGANLQEIVKRSGPLSVPRSCHYIRQAALALQHAHEHGMVHRDIKPGNILVDRNGVVKVLDMGLALILDREDDQLTKKHDDGTLGTADYISPEQAIDSHDVDIRTDIYSLGMTFYFLLVGQPPFEGLAVTQKLLAHQMKKPAPVTDYRKDVPKALLAILEKMMAKSADARLATPGDVADALEPFTQTPIAPPAESEMPKLSPAATGHAPDTETTMGRNDTPVATRTPPSSGPKAKGPTTPTPSSKPRPAPTSPQVTPAPSKASVPAMELDSPTVTESPDVEPDLNFEVDDAGPKSGRSASKTKREPIASTSNPIILATLIAAFVIIPILLVIVIGGLIYFLSRSPSETKSGPPKLTVRKDGDGKNTYSTIKAALARAEPGSIIELADEIIEENVTLERKGITIQAAPDKKIVWRSARHDPTATILIIRNAADFHLKGVGITFDGTLEGKKGHANDLIRITEECPGVIVEDVHCKNFARTALFIVNAAGSSKAPIKIQRFSTETTDKSRPAIFFDANPNFLPMPVNDHIVIENADFRGHDADKAIQFKKLEKASVFGGSVTWPGK